ncbi:MAG: DUF2752 domain-containing protein [Alistipes sp.]|nr:DUF2752 domain-containing protein [Alistipes sp.]
MKHIVKYWRAVVVALLPAIFYTIPADIIFRGEHTVCLFHNITGHNCWGCGMTRALYSLLHFDFSGAWDYNRAVVIVAPLLIWVWIKWILTLVKTAK